jgi:hypothetical protein
LGTQTVDWLGFELAPKVILSGTDKLKTTLTQMKQFL